VADVDLHAACCECLLNRQTPVGYRASRTNETGRRVSSNGSRRAWVFKNGGEAHGRICPLAILRPSVRRRVYWIDSARQPFEAAAEFHHLAIDRVVCWTVAIGVCLTDADRNLVRHGKVN
jgi:hypothetical protein